VVIGAKGGTSDATDGTTTTATATTPRPACIDWERGIGRLKLLETGREYDIEEWWDTKPLVLASLLVQEDLILLRADGKGSYVYAAACACFSFTNIGLDGERGNMKMGNTLRQIHALVPDFEALLAARMDILFKSLKPIAAAATTNNTTRSVYSGWGSNSTNPTGADEVQVQPIEGKGRANWGICTVLWFLPSDSIMHSGTAFCHLIASCILPPRSAI
jgi:hypothetical protein